MGFFYEKYSWLMMIKFTDHIIDMFNKIKIHINTDIQLLVPTHGTSSTYDVFDLYNPSTNHNGQLIISKIGSYDGKNKSYDVRLLGEKYWRRRNMTGVTFKSAVVIPQPVENLEEYLANYENRQMYSMHRFQSVTIGHCRDYYNFTLDMMRTDSWGYIQADGKFDGLVRLLEIEAIDFGSSPLIFKFDRLPIIDYSIGTWRLKSTFIFQKPNRASESYTLFLKPLAKNVWLLLLIFMVIISIALKISFDVEKYFVEKKHLVDSSWSMLLLFVLGAFCQQGATCRPIFFGTRIMSVFVFIFFILIYQFYSASIVSNILLDPPSTLNTLADLVNSTLEAGIEDILIDRNYFQQTTDPVAIELYNKKIKKSGQGDDVRFYEPNLGLYYVQAKGFAFHVETSTAYPIIENTFSNHEICELEEIQMYRTQPMYTNLPKHSPFKEMLNYCMLRLMEDGLLFRLRKFWDARKPECVESAKLIEIKVSLKQFSCALIILSSGMAVTLVILLCEHVMFNWGALRGRFRATVALLKL